MSLFGYDLAGLLVGGELEFTVGDAERPLAEPM